MIAKSRRAVSPVRGSSNAGLCRGEQRLGLLSGEGRGRRLGGARRQPEPGKRVVVAHPAQDGGGEEPPGHLQLQVAGAAGVPAERLRVCEGIVLARRERIEADPPAPAQVGDQLLPVAVGGEVGFDPLDEPGGEGAHRLRRRGLDRSSHRVRISARWSGLSSRVGRGARRVMSRNLRKRAIRWPNPLAGGGRAFRKGCTLPK